MAQQTIKTRGGFTVYVRTREVSDYLKDLAVRSGTQVPWFRRTGRYIFGQWQNAIWRTQGNVAGSSVDWVEWAKDNGRSKRHPITGLTEMRAMIRKEKGTWHGRRTDIMRETNTMKRSIGPQSIQAHHFEWGVSFDQQTKASELDQMWNVERGNYSLMKATVIPAFGKRQERQTIIVIPARPFVFATQPFVDILAENLITYIHQGLSAATTHVKTF